MVPCTVGGARLQFAYGARGRSVGVEAERHISGAAVGSGDVIQRADLHRPVVRCDLYPVQCDGVHGAKRVIHIDVRGDLPAAVGRPGRRRRRQIGGQRDVGGFHGIIDGLCHLNRLEAVLIDRTGLRIDRPAIEILACAVHQVAVLIHLEVPRARVVLLRAEVRDVVHLAVLLRHREEALAGYCEAEGIVSLGDGALHVVDVVGPGDHGTEIILGGVAGGQVIGEAGVDPFVANGLTVRDVVADVAECGGLGT